MKLFLQALLLFLAFSLLPAKGQCKIIYGIPISESELSQKVKQQIESNPILSLQNQTDFTGVGIRHKPKDFNQSFLLCLALLLLLGLFKQINPIYLKNTFKAFGNATLSSRQLRSQLEQNFFPGLFLDILFCLSAALFLYQAVGYINLEKRITYNGSLTFIFGLAIALALIFILRRAVLITAGWLFQIPETMKVFAFNITLFNRILGILLIPFTIIITFGTGFIAHFCLLSALGLGIIFYLFRYIRSRKIFEHFLKINKFHFILYLCASEIMPLAIMIKIISLRIII